MNLQESVQESVDESSESAYTGSTGEILLCEYSLQGRISQARVLDACLFVINLTVEGGNKRWIMG